jgi:hypothetical protein
LLLLLLLIEPHLACSCISLRCYYCICLAVICFLLLSAAVIAFDLAESALPACSAVHLLSCVRARQNWPAAVPALISAASVLLLHRCCCHLFDLAASALLHVWLLPLLH